LIANSDGPIFNQAAQIWNHDFFWQSLSPNPTTPSPVLSKAINQKFTTIEGLITEFKNLAESTFGSGWIWLFTDHNQSLKIGNTLNADNPIRHDGTPIIGIDLWEHAYYLDYRSERSKYLDSIFKLINWDFASKNFTKATI
jgi:Fe-Mn family superoxide dismutase